MNNVMKDFIFTISSFNKKLYIYIIIKNVKKIKKIKYI